MRFKQIISWSPLEALHSFFAPNRSSVNSISPNEGTPAWWGHHLWCGLPVCMGKHPLDLSCWTLFHAGERNRGILGGWRELCPFDCYEFWFFYLQSSEAMNKKSAVYLLYFLLERGFQASVWLGRSPPKSSLIFVSWIFHVWSLGSTRRVNTWTLQQLYPFKKEWFPRTPAFRISLPLVYSILYFAG